MYEPKIVGFLCTWCSYTGADTAGIARMKYPANLRAIRVPCSGRVSPELVMRAFDQGADGVIVLGCHIGECHYDSGNHRAAKRIPTLQALMTFAGLETERLRLDWVSASEGDRFARIVSEFTETVRALGPIRWRIDNRESRFERRPSTISLPFEEKGPTNVESQITNLDFLLYEKYTLAIQEKARHLLVSGEVGCVIGYEVSPRGRTRPVFVYDPEEATKLVWNDECTHNLATYLPSKLRRRVNNANETITPVAVVAKPCDTRAINVQISENRYRREDVHILGVACTGVIEIDVRRESGTAAGAVAGTLQPRCQRCSHREPYVYDTLIGDVNAIANSSTLAGRSAQPLDRIQTEYERIQSLSQQERFEFWLGQFDRCLRCYACRQACPACNCPTCLYERDDSLWVGMGFGVNEKRTFHLGRAYHLAGRCVGCDECERVCPVDIPISLLNQCLANEMRESFNFIPGLTVDPPPLVTMLSEEEV